MNKLNEEEILKENAEEVLDAEKVSEQTEAPPVKEKKKERKIKVDKEKEELRSANLELKEKLLRITAEMQNMRRRFEIDMQSLYKYDGFDLAEKLLPVIDNFERALKIKSEGNEKFLDGFKMIYENMISILEAKGIKEIACQNEQFDPNIMNAVLTEASNEVAPNTVLECLQKGYMYNDRLIRPAMVKVSEEASNENE